MRRPQDAPLRRRAPLLLSLAACAAAPRAPQGPAGDTWTSPPAYPEARRGPVVDTYHGTEVADPYRWLEDADASETRAWIAAQNELTEAFLAVAEPFRTAATTHLTELWDYERYGLPWSEGERVFYTRNDGLQNQSVLYVVDPDSEGASEARVLLDPNGLSSDGTVALAGTSVSRDGRHLAYGVAEAGSDWNTWFVRDVATGHDLVDRLEWVKFSGASWAPEGYVPGFFYARYDAPTQGAELQEQNFFHKLYFHRVGTPQAADELVFEQPNDPEWNLGASVTDDGRWLVIRSTRGTDRRARVFCKDLRGDGPVTPLIPEADARYELVAAVEREGATRFYFRTDLDAPMSRVVAVDPARPERANWVEVLAEGDDQLASVSSVGGHLIARYLVDAAAAVRVFDLDGGFVREVELPGIGSVAGFGGRLDEERTWYTFSSFANPGTLYEYDVASGRSAVFRTPELAFDPERYVTEQVSYTSKDGTRVPLFVTRRADVEPDGDRPTLLYGYGGFGIAQTPRFNAARLGFMDLGGVYAVACLRGGSEYGKAWHEAGKKLAKQNVFDDFIAAGEWLVDSGWTRPERLAIHGGSNGGLLVGACVNQRPDLFGAAIPAVGVMDMLRFPLFTIGWAWTSDYGSPANEDEFRALRAYSPYHNAAPGTCYPPVLVVTSDHDDRVVPAHSFKYAAAMQHAQGCADPVLIRVETRAGHGAGKPTSKRIEEAADLLTFLHRTIGLGAGPNGVW